MYKTVEVDVDVEVELDDVIDFITSGAGNKDLEEIIK